MPISETDLAEIVSREGYRIAPVASQKPRQADSSSDVSPASQASKATQHTPRKDYKAHLAQDLGFLGVDLEPEFRFSPTRKYRADWRVTRYHGKDVRLRKVLIEFEGGLFSVGKRGHSSIAGILRDIAKINEAQLCGFIMIRVAPSDVVSGQAVQWIEQAIKMRAKKYADRV